MDPIPFLNSWFEMSVLKKSFKTFSWILVLSTLVQILSVLREQPRAEASAAAALPSAVRPLADYEEAFQKNSLFGAGPNSFSVLKSSISELLKDYRLKGVVLGNEPEAILEDARTQRSVFVKQGASLGELTIKSIQEGAVVFVYYGEEKELKIQ